MSGTGRSRLALWTSVLYLVPALSSWVLPLVARAEDNMSAIFLVLFAQPWASLWFWIADNFQLASMWPGMVFMLIGILLNTWILYRLITWFSHR
jgi:hypothetical protein